MPSAVPVQEYAERTHDIRRQDIADHDAEAGAEGPEAERTHRESVIIKWIQLAWYRRGGTENLIRDPEADQQSMTELRIRRQLL